jgi:hypothetical protein
MYKSALFRASVITPILPIVGRHLLFVFSSTRRTISKIAPTPLGLALHKSSSGLPSPETYTFHSILRFDLYPGG